MLHAYTQSCCISSLSTQKATFSFFLRIVSAVICKTTAYLARQWQVYFLYLCLNTSSQFLQWFENPWNLYYFHFLNRTLSDIASILRPFGLPLRSSPSPGSSSLLTASAAGSSEFTSALLSILRLALLRFSRAFPIDSFSGVAILSARTPTSSQLISMSRPVSFKYPYKVPYVKIKIFQCWIKFREKIMTAFIH